MSPRAEGVLDGGDLITFHGGLEGVDGIDFGDDDARAQAAQRMRAALADVAVTADDGDLAGDHHVGGALDAVDQRFAAAVEIVELGLGDRVVDVDGGNEELALLQHLIKAMDAGGGLLRDALPILDDCVPETGAFLGDFFQERLDDGDFVVVAGRC